MIAGEAAFTRAELEATALASLGWWHHSIENTIYKLDWTSRVLVEETLRQLR